MSYKSDIDEIMESMTEALKKNARIISLKEFKKMVNDAKDCKALQECKRKLNYVDPTKHDEAMMYLRKKEKQLGC